MQKTLIRWTSVAVALFLMCTVQIAGAQDRSYINPSSAGGDGAPFSGAVMTGDTLYISGMLGLEDGGVPDDPQQEARNVLNAIQGTLEDAGMYIVFSCMFMHVLQLDRQRTQQHNVCCADFDCHISGTQ